MDKLTKWKTTIISVCGAVLLITKAWIPTLSEELGEAISITIDNVVAIAFLIIGMFAAKDQLTLDNFR